jgi:hypothetical protein
MALFKLGQVVATPAALAHCEQHGTDALILIARHCSGDWGDLCADDVAANVHAIQHDLRVLSAYVVGDAKLYVITEWDRSVTTLLMASEY